MEKPKIKYHAGKIVTIFGIIWSIIGLIAGILFPMIYMVPLLFSSWILFGSVGHSSWANGYLMINYNSPSVYIPLFIFEGIVFVIGFVVFLIGLIQLVKCRFDKKTLITSGIYRWIRHPQNLGIILMIFPFTLFLPFQTQWGSWIDLGIRLGDIMSWILMSTFIVISSLIEEKLLIKKLGENSGQYIEYRSTTGMMLPKLRKSDNNRDLILWKQILLVLTIYAVIVVSIYIIHKILSNLGVIIWSRTF